MNENVCVYCIKMQRKKKKTEIRLTIYFLFNKVHDKWPIVLWQHVNYGKVPILRSDQLKYTTFLFQMPFSLQSLWTDLYFDLNCIIESCMSVFIYKETHSFFYHILYHRHLSYNKTKALNKKNWHEVGLKFNNIHFIQNLLYQEPFWSVCFYVGKRTYWTSDALKC